MSDWQKLMMRMMIGFSVLCLTACEKPSQERVILMPPSTLLTRCSYPDEIKLETNGDLARYASLLLQSLDLCAAKIESLRTFYELDNE